MNLRKRVALFAVFFLFAAFACGGCWVTYYEPRQNLERLLAKDDERIEVSSMTIYGQQQEIKITDPASLAYLSRAFRLAVNEGYIPKHSGYYTYSATMRFGSVGTVNVGIDTPDEIDGMTIATPLDTFGDPLYYWAKFPQPMPELVADALKKMRRPP